MTATKDFPREYKYTLGQKIKEELIELVVMIYRANSARDKAQHIESILERVQAIQLMMRLAHDMRILPRRHYAALSEMTDSLARQAQGWLKGTTRGSERRLQLRARADAASLPDTPHPVGIILIIVVLVTIGEVLVPRVVSIVLRGRPVVGVTLAISWSGKAIFAFRAFAPCPLFIGPRSFAVSGA